ncbi:MAG: class I SAM-dependent methyltransferase [Anaerolineales bacterium]|nr:class I SAM-dependent methyltransferase [Anaerolineales bacterium]
MNSSTRNDADAGNWVSKRILITTAVLAAAFGGMTMIWRPFLVLGLLFLLAFVYFSYAHRLFSPAGHNLQKRIRDQIFEHFHWDGQGKAIDIGCGNGPLVIQLAKMYPHAEITGIDFWGGMWDYSKEMCEEIARREGVAGNTVFQKASASRLPYEDGAFDAAVSNFVFHEVADTKDKREVLREALRVVRKGGSYCFQDLFLAEAIYGDIAVLLETVRSWDVESVSFVNTTEADFIPSVLKLPFMVGKIGILHGVK